MAEAKEGPDWHKIMGCSIAGFVMFCILLALGTLALIFVLPFVSWALVLLDA